MLLFSKRQTEEWQLRIRPDDLVEHQIHHYRPIFFFLFPFSTKNYAMPTFSLRQWFSAREWLRLSAVGKERRHTSKRKGFFFEEGILLKINRSNWRYTTARPLSFSPGFRMLLLLHIHSRSSSFCCFRTGPSGKRTIERERENYDEIFRAFLLNFLEISQ